MLGNDRSSMDDDKKTTAERTRKVAGIVFLVSLATFGLAEAMHWPRFVKVPLGFLAIGALVFSINPEKPNESHPETSPSGGGPTDFGDSGDGGGGD